MANPSRAHAVASHESLLDSLDVCSTCYTSGECTDCTTSPAGPGARPRVRARHRRRLRVRPAARTSVVRRCLRLRVRRRRSCGVRAAGGGVARVRLPTQLSPPGVLRPSGLLCRLRRRTLLSESSVCAPHLCVSLLETLALTVDGTLLAPRAFSPCSAAPASAERRPGASSTHISEYKGQCKDFSVFTLPLNLSAPVNRSHECHDHLTAHLIGRGPLGASALGCAGGRGRGLCASHYNRHARPARHF